MEKKIKEFLISDKASAVATRFVLGVLGIGVVLVAGAVAPNIFRCFKKYRNSGNFSDKKIRNSLYALKRAGLAKITKNNKGTLICLTAKGRSRLNALLVDDIKITRPAKWDKKWRVVIFDIPIRFNKSREALRARLKLFGFFQLQKSVWVYPYSCEREIILLADMFKVEEFVEVLVVEKFLNEENVKGFFDL